MYFLQWDDRYVVGSYRHEPVIVDPEQIDDSRVAPADLEFDDAVFASGWQEAGRLVPEIRHAGRTQCVYGMFSFTPDAKLADRRGARCDGALPVRGGLDHARSWRRQGGGRIDDRWRLRAGLA